MSDTTTTHPEDSMANASREDIMAALFANMVIQQTNMAMMLMGKAPHPETGQTMKDLEAARMFIDQVEMLETKTKGNLNKQEEGLLKQALAALHMAFVEAVEEPGTPSASAAQPQPQRAAPSPAPEAGPAPGAKASQPAAAPSAPPAEGPEESRKKFSKKY